MSTSSWTEASFNKINGAFEAGCRRFDGVIKFRGCPMASNKLVGNIQPKVSLVSTEKEGISKINSSKFEEYL